MRVDPRGKERGRGAYVCPNEDCINKALYPEKLKRVYRIGSDKPISSESLHELKQNLLELVDVHDS